VCGHETTRACGGLHVDVPGLQRVGEAREPVERDRLVAPCSKPGQFAVWHNPHAPNAERLAGPLVHADDRRDPDAEVAVERRGLALRIRELANLVAAELGSTRKMPVGPLAM
jgi:hypothetical protein